MPPALLASRRTAGENGQQWRDAPARTLFLCRQPCHSCDPPSFLLLSACSFNWYRGLIDVQASFPGGAEAWRERWGGRFCVALSYGDNGAAIAYEVAPSIMCLGVYAPSERGRYKEERALPPEEAKALLQASAGARELGCCAGCGGREQAARCFAMCLHALLILSLHAAPVPALPIPLHRTG